jgi:predicted nuclease of predicted toxin-antitoxin system
VKIVADESVDKQIVDRLRADGHEVLFVAELDPGIDDEEVLLRSRQATAILLTADKDFGELVFRQRFTSFGSTTLSAGGTQPNAKARLVAAAFDRHGEEFSAGFAVLSEGSLRLRKGPP